MPEKRRNIKPKARELIISKILVLVGIYSSIIFFCWLTKKSFRQDNLLYLIFIIAFAYKVVSYLIEWLLIWHPSVPEKPILKTKFTVDVLTTYVEGEPKDMLKKSLLAIKSITYPHETFLCDEANDPELKEFCMQHKIHHVIREKKIDAKAGNINNALNTVAKGEIVLILDPDHIVFPSFLDEVLPFFEDKNMGFVQVVQAYSNQYETIVAKAAAEQTYQFYGPVMMTLNSYGAAPAIGANCTFRRTALDSIGGHAAGLTEDMHTTLKLKAKGWKSVYNPVILSKGLVPWNYSGYCLQQLKWSCGSFNLLFHAFPKVVHKLTWPQRLAFLTVPLFYFSGFMALVDFLLPVIALLFGIVPINLNGLDFILFYFQLYFIAQVIRFYHQKWYYEEHEKGTAFLGGIMFKASWWTTLCGFIFSSIGKKIPYIPTPKDFKLETPWKLLLPNFIIILISFIAIVFGLTNDLTPPGLFMAFLAFLNIIILSLGSFMAMQKQIVFFHQLFHGSFISKGSSTRKFLFKVKHSIYNFFSKNLAVSSSLLIILLLNLVIIIISPNLHYGLLNPDYIKQKISGIIDKGDKLNNNKNYGQLYMGRNYHHEMSFANTNSSFIKGDFYLNNENNLPVEDFLDSCYANNMLPFLSVSVDTTKQKLQSKTQALTLNHIFKEIKSQYLPVILMFDRDLNKVSDTLYNDFFNTAYRKADSMAIHSMITWVWHSNNVEGDNFLSHHLNTVNWIYTENEGAVVYKNNYYALRTKDVNLPLLVDNSKVQYVSSNDFEKHKYVRNIVGILGAQTNASNKLPYNLKEVFEKPPVNPGINRLGLPEYVKGISYNPGTGGGNSDKLPLTVDKLTKDFELIHEMGCNTIRRFSASIYDYNLLRAAKKFDLDVLYGFWFDWEYDYYKDFNGLEKRKNKVLKLVQRHKADSSIVAWGLGNETWNQLNHYYGQPYLSIVRQSYLKFLKNLVAEIKLIDTGKPVFAAENQNPASMYSFSEYVPQIDFFGINAYYKENVSRLKNIARRNLPEIPYLVSEYGNKGYWSPVYNSFDDHNRVLEQSSMEKANDFEINWNKYIYAEKENNLGGVAFCWQDRFECTATWFGVIDIFGNKKPAYYAVKDAYTGNRENTWANHFPIPEFRIIIDPTYGTKNKFRVQAIPEKEEEVNKYQFKWIVYTDFDFEKIKETDFKYGDSSFSFTVPGNNKPYRIHLYVKDVSGNVITETLPINFQH